MFEFSASKYMYINNDRRSIPTYLLAYILTPIVKEIENGVEQGREVTTLNIIKQYNIIFFV